MTVAAKARPKKKTAEAIYARVQHDGSLRCEDAVSNAVMRRKKIRRGDLIRLVVSRPRDLRQWKKAHALGTLIAHNIEDFGRFLDEQNRADSHDALKELQRLSGVECDDTSIELPGAQAIVYRTPRSLAFDEMEEGTFQAAYSGFCQYLIKKYWHTLDEAAIEDMAKLVGQGA